MQATAAVSGHSEYPISLEITPPIRPSRDVLLRRARLLGDLPASIHVIQREDRMSSLEASCMLRELGLTPVWHVATRGRSRSELRHDVLRARDAGVRRVLCLRGDHSAPDHPSTPKIREAIGLIRDCAPELTIGATLNQYGAIKPVIANLIAKIDAGASFVQTQPVLCFETFERAALELRAQRPNVRLMPMVIPLLSVADAQRIGARLGIAVPVELSRSLERGGSQAGWRSFAERVRQLASAPFVDALAIMTPKLDLDPEIAATLRRAVEEAWMQR